MRVEEIRGVYVCGGEKQRVKKKKRKRKEKRNVYLEKNKCVFGKNKIKNNKKLKLRNVTTIFLQ